MIKINPNKNKRVIIVDNFYSDPYALRQYALAQEYEPNINYYKGSRSIHQFNFPGIKESFEELLGFNITNWTETYDTCTKFQFCTAEDSLVYHCDTQTWAGIIYLTPNAPFSSGTSLFAHRDSKIRNAKDFNGRNIFDETGFYDKTKFELVDTIGNVFNRLILFDAKSIHAASEYFGTKRENGRLFQIFFFD